MIRCPRCNSNICEIKESQDGHGIFKRFLKKRTYIHCMSCHNFEDIDDFKKGIMGR